MDDLLYVWIYPSGEDKPVLCGMLELLQGRRCVFSYDSSWLARKGAFPLSPDIPLGPGVVEPPEGMDIHPVFEDAGPDRWGKNVINKVFNPLRRSHLEYLELAGENRIGALGFSRSGAEYIMEKGASFNVVDLPELIRAADALALQMPIDDDLRRLLRPGSAAGGARPKAAIKHKNSDWIAKFPAESDQYDMCAFEHASLVLAKLCGVNTVESELLKVGKQNVLLVKRFDREEGRLHFVSARTMLVADGVVESRMGYADLADVVRRYCSSPEETCHQLFRRMVVNVLIENSDDHERNHGFLYRDGQWALSPAYDVLPQRQGLGYHHLRIGKDGNMGNIANALSDCQRFLLKPAAAELIVSEIFGKMLGWRDVFANEGVSQQDIKSFEGYVLRDPVFWFGRAPAKPVPPSGREYSGRVEAVDAKCVYLEFGRKDVVQLDRTSVYKLLPPNILILPNAELNVKFKEGQMVFASIKGPEKNLFLAR